MSDPGAETHPDGRTRKGALAPETAPGTREVPFLERHLVPILRETMLLPLVIVVAGHVVAFFAPTLLLAVRDRRIAAQAAVLLLLFFSGKTIRLEIQQRSGVGIVSALVIGLWIASAAGAVAADHYGIF